MKLLKAVPITIVAIASSILILDVYVINKKVDKDKDIEMVLNDKFKSYLKNNKSEFKPNLQNFKKNEDNKVLNTITFNTNIHNLYALKEENKQYINYITDDKNKTKEYIELKTFYNKKIKEKENLSFEDLIIKKIVNFI